MPYILRVGATAAIVALGGGAALAGDRVVGSSPYRQMEAHSGELQKPPEKPNPAIQDGRAAAVAHVPGGSKAQTAPMVPSQNGSESSHG